MGLNLFRAFLPRVSHGRDPAHFHGADLPVLGRGGSVRLGDELGLDKQDDDFARFAGLRAGRLSPLTHPSAKHVPL